MFVIAKCQFRYHSGRVQEGESYPEDAPVVKEFPQNFLTPDEWAEQKAKKRVMFGPGPVEQATAAPGEKRQTRRPAK